MARFAKGLIVGALCSGVIMACVWYVISHYGDYYFFGSKAEHLFAIVGGIFGSIVGGSSGAVIGSLRLTFFRAILFGLAANVLACLFLLFFTGEDPVHHTEWFSVYLSLIISGVISAAIVSLVVNTSRNSN